MEPGTLISVSIDANPAMAICNPLGFSTNPLGYPLNAPGIYGHDDDSMFTNSGCSAFFKGCFAGIHNTSQLEQSLVVRKPVFGVSN